MTTELLCPKLADPHFIITANNFDSLLLSNYERTNGTEVKVTCLSYSSHQLIGPSILKCLGTGQWDRSIPACVPRTDDDGVYVNRTDTALLTTTSVYHLLPYIVAFVILCLTCITLSIAVCVLLRMLKKCQFASTCNRKSYVLDSSDSSVPECGTSSTPETGSQTDTWVEMATSRNFRCHELAFSRNKMVENLKYKHLYPEHWSGY